MRFIIPAPLLAAALDAILMVMGLRAIYFLFFSAWWLAAGSGGGLRWNAPANWKPEAERPMRLATYSVPAAPGDHEGGECGVFYFGPGQGGSVEANLDRWIGQFLQAGGKPSRAAAKIEMRTVHGIPVTTVDVSGAYTGLGGPMVQAGKPVPGYRLLGAIAEGPEGSLFFKFTGPAQTVDHEREAFEKMLGSLVREDGAHSGSAH